MSSVTLPKLLPQFRPYDWIGVASRRDVPPGYEVVAVVESTKPVGWGEKHKRVRVIARKSREYDREEVA